MTKPLNPEIKALRRIDRAARAIPPDARQRVLEWLIARECGLPQVRLPVVRQAETPERVEAPNPKDAS